MHARSCSLSKPVSEVQDFNPCAFAVEHKQYEPVHLPPRRAGLQPAEHLAAGTSPCCFVATNTRAQWSNHNLHSHSQRQ